MHKTNFNFKLNFSELLICEIFMMISTHTFSPFIQSFIASCRQQNDRTQYCHRIRANVDSHTDPYDWSIARDIRVSIIDNSFPSGFHQLTSQHTIYIYYRHIYSIECPNFCYTYFSIIFFTPRIQIRSNAIINIFVKCISLINWPICKWHYIYRHEFSFELHIHLDKLCITSNHLDLFLFFPTKVVKRWSKKNTHTGNLFINILFYNIFYMC